MFSKTRRSLRATICSIFGHKWGEWEEDPVPNSFEEYVWSRFCERNCGLPGSFEVSRDKPV